MMAYYPFRPFRETELTILERLYDDPEVLGPYAWPGWSGRKLRREWDQDRLLSADGGMLALVRDDTPVGAVSWRAVRYNGISQCWNAGLCVLPEERQQGLAASAFRALTRYLFDHTQAHRVEVHADVENSVVCDHCHHAGLVREGVARGAAWRAGRWRDVAVFAVLRDDPPPPTPEASSSAVEGTAPPAVNPAAVNSDP